MPSLATCRILVPQPGIEPRPWTVKAESYPLDCQGIPETISFFFFKQFLLFLDVFHICLPWSKKWQPTPVFLPGKFHGQRSLAGCSPWGRKRWTWLSDFHIHLIFVYPRSCWWVSRLFVSLTTRSNAIANVLMYMLWRPYTNIPVASVFRSRIAGLKSGCICNCDRWWQISLPRWCNGKESACQCRRRGFDPWVGKIRWRRKWQPTPVLMPGESHGQRSLSGYSPWGHKEPMTEHPHPWSK